MNKHTRANLLQVLKSNKYRRTFLTLFLTSIGLGRAFSCDAQIRDLAAGSNIVAYSDIRKMPTDLDRMIELFGAGCIPTGKPCSIVKVLAAKFYDISRHERLDKFLQINGFLCEMHHYEEIGCTHLLRFVFSPPENLRIEDTYKTSVCFRDPKSIPLSAEDISVSFVRVERQLR